MDEFRELELPFIPDTGAPNPVLLQTDDSAALLFGARQLMKDGGPSQVVGNAVVEFGQCHATRFGYPNDEAMAGIPRFDGLSYGACEVSNSSWIEEIRQLNKKSFPDAPYLVNAKHFVFVFHDSTFECVADGLNVDFNHELWEQLWPRVYQKLLRYAAG
ncbi:MAG: hypothetical protein AAFX56_11085 [Pseudomonadota bacterium]